MKYSLLELIIPVIFHFHSVIVTVYSCIKSCYLFF